MLIILKNDKKQKIDYPHQDVAQHVFSYSDMFISINKKTIISY